MDRQRRDVLRKARQLVSKKHSSNCKSYHVKVIDEIIYNEKSGLVAQFKDYLLYDDTSEFLKRFYLKSELNKRLRKIFDYYEEFSRIFPNYIILPQAKYIYKNIQRKQRVIDNQQIMEAKANRLQEGGSTSRVFDTKIYNSIINVSRSRQSLLSDSIPSIRNPNPDFLLKDLSLDISLSLLNGSIRSLGKLTYEISAAIKPSSLKETRQIRTRHGKLSKSSVKSFKLKKVPSQVVSPNFKTIVTAAVKQSQMPKTKSEIKLVSSEPLGKSSSKKFLIKSSSNASNKSKANQPFSQNPPRDQDYFPSPSKQTAINFVYKKKILSTSTSKYKQGVTSHPYAYHSEKPPEKSKLSITPSNLHNDKFPYVSNPRQFNSQKSIKEAVDTKGKKYLKVKKLNKLKDQGHQKAPSMPFHQYTLTESNGNLVFVYNKHTNVNIYQAEKPGTKTSPYGTYYNTIHNEQATQPGNLVLQSGILNKHFPGTTKRVKKSKVPSALPILQDYQSQDPYAFPDKKTLDDKILRTSKYFNPSAFVKSRLVESSSHPGKKPTVLGLNERVEKINNIFISSHNVHKMKQSVGYSREDRSKHQKNTRSADVQDYLANNHSQFRTLDVYNKHC